MRRRWHNGRCPGRPREQGEVWTARHAVGKAQGPAEARRVHCAAALAPTTPLVPYSGPPPTQPHLKDILPPMAHVGAPGAEVEMAWPVTPPLRLKLMTVYRGGWGGQVFFGMGVVSCYPRSAAGGTSRPGRCFIEWGQGLLRGTGGRGWGGWVGGAHMQGTGQRPPQMQASKILVHQFEGRRHQFECAGSAGRFVCVWWSGRSTASDSCSMSP